MSKRSQRLCKRKRLQRGEVWYLSLTSGPPGNWIFCIHGDFGNNQDILCEFTISENYEIWLEEIVRLAFRALGTRLGQTTIVPTQQLIALFSNQSAQQLK